MDSMPTRIINEEIAIYQRVSDRLKYANLSKTLGRTYHEAQQAVITDMDNDYLNCYVLTLGRRIGKTVVASDIAMGELLKPYASVLLLTPTYINAKILFTNVMKNVKQTKMKIVSQNTNQFSFTLENGATFVATSQKTVKNVLGSRISLLIVDETQDITGLIELVEQFIEPAMMDYGVKSTGVPYAKEIYLGTPRGVGTEFHDLFTRELNKSKYKSWKSYNYPSKTNPMLPLEYLKLKKEQLPEYIYLMEYEAKWLRVGANAVYFSFNEEVNTFDMKDILPFINKYSTIISAVDIGFQDSTAKLNAWVNEKGDYYITNAYINNKCSTSQHAEAFKKLDSELPASPELVYCDPAAAQSAYDLSSTYDYVTTPAINKLMEGIACVNELLAPTPKRKPRLYINKDLHELIRQMQTLSWKDKQSKTFKKDPKGTHYDLALACLRYLIYSYELKQNAGEFVVI